MNQAIESGQSQQPAPEQDRGQVIFASLQRMQELIVRERAAMRHFGEAPEIQAQIQQSADAIIESYQEQSWTSIDKFLARMVPASNLHRVDRELFAARRRKEENDRARKLLESV